MTEATTGSAQHRDRDRRRSRRRRIGAVVLVAVGVVVLGLAWLGIRGWMAKGELDDVAALQPRLSSAMAAGDIEALGAVVADAEQHARRAAELTTDPIWRATEAVPIIGANTAAVRIVAESVRDLAVAAQPVLHVSTPSRSGEGRFDLTAVSAAAQPVDDFAAVFSRVDGSLGGMSTAGLVGPVEAATARLRAAVAAAAPTVAEAASVAQILPAMLGAHGARSILVMVQNSAEVRTGGGITGSFILLRADGDRLAVVDQVDSSMFPHRETPIAELPADLVTLYGQSPGRFVMNATMTTDFALSARLASAWWQSIGRPAPDAVIAIDPAVLTAMLTITGPITLGDGTIVDPADVVGDVLVTPYLEKTPVEQTAVQREVFDRLFAQITSAPIDPLRWVRALAKPVADGRISIFSTHSDEQVAVTDGAFSGTLGRFRAAGPDAVGVYFNDATTGKMDTFLHVDLAASVRTCRADGAADVMVAVTLRSAAPAGARTFAESMTGAANPAAPGDITTDVTVMVPREWFVGGVTLDGVDVSATAADGSDSSASLARVTLRPGEQKTLAFGFVAKNGAQLRPVLVHTPMMNDVSVAEVASTACG